VRDGVEDRDLGWKKIRAELKLAARSHVTVGIHDDQQHDGGLSTAQVGAFHEFGLGVPSRPFLSTTIDEQANEIAKFADKVYFGPILEGRANARRGLGLLGEFAQQKVQKTVRDGRSDWPPLAEGTKRKKASTLGGDKAASFVGGDGNPLIDTGQLLASIRHKVHIGGVP